MTQEQRHHLPVVVESASSIRKDGSRNYVHTADVRGRFTTARRVGFAVLVGIYAALPWVTVAGRPAVLFDVAHRRFFLFGATLNAQDTWMAFFVVTGLAFALVVLTALLGRIWCGWACPQTVFLEGIYRRIERLVEGPRERRLKRNAGPWTADKALRKSATHALCVATSLLLAHVFLGYFVPVRELPSIVRQSPLAHPEAFAWVFGAAALLYFNFAWFREQTCVAVCPYGRLQSVLLDQDSIVVGYDARRGEPRGKAADPNAGDCVDCRRCVTVCPTGIDIRNGLQLDCVACASCVDACDAVMDKLGRERGLIRFDSLRGLAGEKRQFWRPRLWVYVALGTLGLAVASFSLRDRAECSANVLRLPGAPYTVEEGGLVRNAFEIHLVNKLGRRATYALEPEPHAGAAFVVPMNRVTLEPLAGAHVPFFVTVPRRDFHGDFPVRVRVRPEGGRERAVTAPFLGPSS
jgi:cytochrome c oxidase accessory protein FixG